RIPVIAAPTPIPVIPASEIGESITRSVPNFSTSPDKTLNGVPASATSSPIMKMDSSRRISSVRASLTAWAKVISRPATGGVIVSCINVLIDFGRIGIRGVQGKLHRVFRLGLDFLLNRLELRVSCQFFIKEPRTEKCDRISVRFPLLLLGFG